MVVFARRPAFLCYIQRRVGCAMRNFGFDKNLSKLVMIAAAALVLLAAASVSRAAATVYLPGVAPNAFKDDERVILKANKVTSTKSQVPYDYYDLPFCKGKRSHAKADNVGERLSGDTTTNSPYELSMKKDERCAVLCRRSYKKSDMAMFRRMIDEEYRVHWLLDSLPVAVRNDELGFVSRGYPIGFSEKKGKHARHYLYNHVSIIIRYNENPEAFEGARIVGFEVVPRSIKHEYDAPQKDFNKASTPLKTCGLVAPGQQQSSNPASYQAVDSPDEVIFTYDVKWEPSTATWENRWDTYLRGNPDDEIHYFSIINSLMIVLFLTGVVTMIMLRTLRKDITAYNEIQTLEEAQEESGWKLVHGDVFRPPTSSPMVLAVLAGTGLQLLAMTFVTLVCAYLGLVSPQNRGTLLTALVLIFVFMGSVAGYASSRVYKLFNGKDWKQCTLLTATLFPSIVAVIFLGINAFVSLQGSSAAAPFLTLLTVLFLWVGVSTPLVFIGSYFGFKKETISVPVRTNQIVRLIPDQVWYTHPFFAVALGGILPFGAVCIELFFIMSALWLHQYYYMFGFIFTVFVILIATCALITIVMCYFQLCNEDYHWWWRSFLSAGSSGVYLFIYSIYFFSKLEIEGFVATVLYFAYMLMISITFSIITGSIGFFACLWFVRLIYSAIKVD